MENSMAVSQKTKNRVAIWSSNPTLGLIFGQNYNSKRNVHTYVNSGTIHISQDMETYISIDRWIYKEDVVHIYNGLLLIKKKNEIMPFAATWVDSEIIILNEVSQKEKDKKKRKTNTIWYHLYVESKIWHRWTFLWNRLTDIENRFVVVNSGWKGWSGSLRLVNANFYIYSG